MDEGLPAGIVTILCTDVEGSTALRNRRRDDAAPAVVDIPDDIVRQLIAATRDLRFHARWPVQLQGLTAHRRLHEILWHPMPAPAGTGLW